jgi:hypothetical protein
MLTARSTGENGFFSSLPEAAGRLEWQFEWFRGIQPHILVNFFP